MLFDAYRKKLIKKLKHMNTEINVLVILQTSNFTLLNRKHTFSKKPLTI